MSGIWGFVWSKFLSEVRWNFAATCHNAALYCHSVIDGWTAYMIGLSTWNNWFWMINNKGRCSQLLLQYKQAPTWVGKRHERVRYTLLFRVFCEVVVELTTLVDGQMTGKLRSQLPRLVTLHRSKYSFNWPLKFGTKNSTHRLFENIAYHAYGWPKSWS